MNRTRNWVSRLASALLALATVGCSDEPGPLPEDAGVDAAQEDSGPSDAGLEDTGTPDAGPEDAGPEDAGAEDAGTDAGPPDSGPPVICTSDADCDDGDACTGTETCGAGGFACEMGTSMADGTACDADMMAGTADICLGGACSASRCGDGFTDAATGEVCDDGNDVNGDGCDDCRFTCEADAECDDAEACNGAETCSAAHVCVPGTDLPAGTLCASDTGRCVSGTCLPDSCTTADECQDGDMCNGDEICGSTGCAVAAAPTDCDDMDDCTMDGCDPATGCTHVFIDADRDGHAPMALGTCGTDCDDARADTNPDSAEICGNGRDDDCDGMTDEAGVTAWYADCDGDGYAAAGAMTRSACTMPPAGLSGCATGGGWTTRNPATPAQQDCYDGNAAVNPAQFTFQTTAISGVPASSDFDYNCDMAEERRATAVGACMRMGLSCVLTEGWMGAVAACGATERWITGCTNALTTCNAVTEMRQQACR